MPHCKQSRWNWVTDEMFEEMLVEIVQEMPTDKLLDIGDVRLTLREELNNEILEALAETHERCTECGSEFDTGGICRTCEPDESTDEEAESEET